MTKRVPPETNTTVIVLEAGPDLAQRAATIAAHLTARSHARLIVVDTTGSLAIWTFVTERLPHATGRVDYYRTWQPAGRADLQGICRALVGSAPVSAQADQGGPGADRGT